MKKTISIILICVMIVSLVACAPKLVQEKITISISEETKVVRESYFTSIGILGMTEEQQRAYYEMNWVPLFTGRTSQDFPSVQITNDMALTQYDFGDVYTITGDKSDCIVFYIHGGAWVWAVEKAHVKFCDKLVDALGAKVYMPIYPLAPQASYVEGYEMLEKAYDEALKENKPIIMMGDSAGGTLTLGLTLLLKEKGKTLPAKVVVMAPCADASFTNPEIDIYETRDGMLPRYSCEECAKLWANGADLGDKLLSPINGDYTGFPDTMMFVGTCDILCADDLLLYDKMCAAKMNATLVVGEGLWHVFSIYDIAEQAHSIELISNFCK